MKTLIVLVVLVIVLIAVGWITFSRNEGEANIHIQTDRIQQDAEGAVEAGKDLADDTGEALHRMTESADENGAAPDASPGAGPPPSSPERGASRE